MLCCLADLAVCLAARLCCCLTSKGKELLLPEVEA